ncbi:DUF58 domain-containing protein [Haloplanus sp. GCM10025708]|uniref:DUF58 domain-containing protein n=1 Tax=Haloferacaceae TaxID=1644056 RepID=UPI00360AC55E
MTVERIHRWDAGLACAVVLAAVGVALRDPVVLGAAVVPITYVVFGAVSPLPDEPPIAVERSVSESSPVPGERVAVELTVRNVGESTLTDVRVVDGVPDHLTVVEGSPRASLALRPGSESTVEYELVARRGTHDFADPVVRMRTLSATRRRTDRLEATGETAVDCLAAVGETPLRDTTTLRVGELATDTPGSGLEFYATREYRADDPINRVDWRRYARTGDLTTVQFREQRAARVVLVVDARESARVVPGPGHPDGAELCAYAARRTFDSLREGGHHVGLAALGVDVTAVDAVLSGDADLPWVDAGTGAETSVRVDAVLDAACENEGRTAAADGGSRLAERIARRLSRDAQVVFLTPAADDEVVPLVRRLRAEGYDTTVVSPDRTDATTPGGSIESVRRRLRLTRLRESDAVVVDWNPADPLWTALSAIRLV